MQNDIEFKIFREDIVVRSSDSSLLGVVEVCIRLIIYAAVHILDSSNCWKKINISAAESFTFQGVGGHSDSEEDGENSQALPLQKGQARVSWWVFRKTLSCIRSNLDIWSKRCGQQCTDLKRTTWFLLIFAKAFWTAPSYVLRLLKSCLLFCWNRDTCLIFRPLKKN